MKNVVRKLGPVMLDIAGCTVTIEEREILAHPQVGGVILFARNYDNPQQLIDLTRQIRESKPHILIAVDHEGGRVQRFRSGFTRIPSMHSLASLHPELIVDTAKLMAWELIATGIDFSFSPVLDRYNFDSAVIGDRAFAESPQEIVQHARNFIRGLTQAGMAAIGKHFPGHGGIVEDTHRQVAIDERSFEEIAASDLFPFAQLAGELQGIMPAHVIFPCLSDLPAGFSNEWLKGILREQLAFKGTIFSDDLSMMAAQIAGGPLERGLAALKAGCSMVLLCNQAKDAIALIEGFEALGVEVEDHHIGQLSALHRRQQSGFNWRNLHATAFWKDTQKSLSALNDRI